MVDTVRSPIVHGNARSIRTETGVGKADSDGPKSPTTIRFQNTTYWLQGLPSSP